MKPYRFHCQPLSKYLWLMASGFAIALELYLVNQTGIGSATVMSDISTVATSIPEATFQVDQISRITHRLIEIVASIR